MPNSQMRKAFGKQKDNATICGTHDINCRLLLRVSRSVFHLSTIKLGIKGLCAIFKVTVDFFGKNN